MSLQWEKGLYTDKAKLGFVLCACVSWGRGPGCVYVYVYFVEMEDMLFGLTDQAIIS